MPGGQNDRSHQAVLHARRPPADAAVLREEGPAAAESHGGPHPHVFRGGRGGAGASAAAHPRPRRESGRRRNHHKNETSDGRYAEADRGPSRLRPRERRRSEGSRGAEAAGSPGEGGLGAAAARRSLLRKRRKHIMVDERDGRTPPVPDILGILPLRSAVVFPHAVVPLAAGRPSSVRLIEDAAQSGRLVGAVMQRNPSEDAPDGDGLHPVGTLTIIHKVLKQPDGTLRIVEVIETTPYLRARVESRPEEETPDVETEALTRSAALLFQRVVSLSPTLPDELASVVSGTEPASQVADLITASLPTLPLPLKQELLETVPVKERLQKLAAALGKETEVLELGSKIQSEIQSEMSKTQREYYLREQLKAIQKELGESDERTQEVDALRAKVEAAGMPEEARKEALRELDRLAKMPPAAAEYTVARTYIDWLVSMPWTSETTDNVDIETASRILDEDHEGLEKIKERILEHLAVKKMRPAGKDPILCFVGPPGVGKTSLGRSIARALGRKFHRISLGGMRDEAEIRGHRRTYIGALPGQIIQGLRRAESRNPVFMLDEIDKLGMDFRGDPAAALLE